LAQGSRHLLGLRSLPCQSAARSVTQLPQLTTEYTMGIFDLENLQWTPAACVLAFQSIVCTIPLALCIILGQTDGFYKFEPHTKEISSRPYEVVLGSALLGWGLGVVGAVIAGGAHFMCVLQLLPMLCATYYHYKAKGKSNVVTNVVFMVVIAYLAFVPLPEVKPVLWTPAAIYAAFNGGMAVLTGIAFFAGKADKLIYANEPHTKALMTRQGELQVGSCFLGIGLAFIGATIAGGAQDMCILYLPAMIGFTYHHYSHGATTSAIVNAVFMVGLVYFGFVR